MWNSGRRIVAPLCDQKLWVKVLFINVMLPYVAVHLVKIILRVVIIVMYGRFDKSFDMTPPTRRFV